MCLLSVLVVVYVVQCGAGTEKFLDSLATWMDHDPALIMSAIHCLRLPAPVRSVIGSIMYSARVPDLLYVAL